MEEFAKRKKSTYSCFEVETKSEFNPIKHIKRWGRNIRYAYQRVKYAYCDCDVWSIDWWFLNVVPNMLEDLKNTTNGYPDDPDDFSQALVGIGEPAEDDDEGMLKWKDTLSEMIFLFREANKDTCTRENKYEKEYKQALAEFKKKYGVFGEGLKTEEEKAEEKESGSYRWYMLSDVPEYEEIDRLHSEEAQKIQEYRNECKDKGFDLFKLWFWNLWD